MGFDVSAGILIILGPTVWPLCMGQDFRLRITADELANGPSPKKEMAIGEVKTFTENWVSKQSFFVLILPMA